MKAPQDARRSTKGQARREQILEKAAREFAARGYHATTIAHILDGLGIARGTFYLYFENKRAIFDELIKSLMERLAGAIRVIDLADTERGPHDQLQDNLVRVFTILLEDRGAAKILLEGGGGADPEFEKKIDEFYAHARFLLKRSLEHGRRIGLLRPIDKGFFADCALGAVREVIRHALSQPPEKADVARLAAQLIDYHTHGVFAQKPATTD